MVILALWPQDRTTMRTASLFLLLIAHHALLAQPSIDATNTQLVPGPTYTFNVSLFIEGGAGGENAVWDFSELVPAAVATVTLQDPADSFLEGSLPNSTVFTVNSLSNKTKAYESSPAGLLFWGVFNNLDQQLLRYSDASLELAVPCTFGTTWTDLSVADYSLGGLVLGSRTGNLVGEADGFGDLVMPFGTISNVLRVHLIENITDNTVSGSALIEGSRFQYYKPGIPAPLVETINNLINSTSSGQSLEQFVQWLSSDITGMEAVVDRSIGMDVFPQPARGNTTVTYGARGKVDFTLLDPSGRVVRRIGGSVHAPGIHQMQLDLAGLSAGIYVLQATTNGQEQGTVRVVVE